MSSERPAAARAPGAAAPGAVVPTYALSGWVEALAYTFAIGALSLTYAVGHRIGAHPGAFILYAMAASAVAMLAITGFGTDARAVMLHPASWVVGFAIILIEVFYFLLLGLVAPAHGNLVLRIGVPLAMVAGYVLLRRRPPPLAIAAGVVIVGATAFVVGLTAPDVRWPVALWGTLAAVCMVVRGFAGEFHPWNRAARSVREKLRITGLVVLVTSLLSLALTALASAAMAAGLVPRIGLVPDAAQLLHGPTILLGTLAGGAILTAMAYLGFSSVVKITTENLTAMMALSPVTTWLFQAVGVAVGLIAVAPLPAPLIVAMAVLVASVLTIFWAGRHARRAR
ncbi:MAG: hypothetical protein U1F10_00675 [Burkholderiales bacterium]